MAMPPVEIEDDGNAFTALMRVRKALLAGRASQAVVTLFMERSGAGLIMRTPTDLLPAGSYEKVIKAAREVCRVEIKAKELEKA